MTRARARVRQSLALDGLPMLRLTLVFVVWIASTAAPLERPEAVRLARLTDTNVRTILPADHGCADANQR